MAGERFCQWFFAFHFKNWKEVHMDLVISRALCIVLLLGYTIIDTSMYSSGTTDKSDVLIFLHGSRYFGVEILVVIYANGAAAFGISIEIYLFCLYVIANCILVAQNCGDSAVLKSAILWTIKVFFLFFAVELGHRNFRILRKYKERFNLSARAMLRQALYFSVTMLFLSSPGFKTLYHAINKSLPHRCAYDTSHCAIVDLYEPLFSHNDSKCLDDLTAYVAGREQLRVLRNFLLLNGVAYSIFNVSFLDISRNAKNFWLRILLVLVFATLSTSVLVSNVDPLIFIDRYQLAYSIIECIMFMLMLCLLGFNLYRFRGRRVSPPQQPILKPTIATILQVPVAPPSELTAAPQAFPVPSEEEIPEMEISPRILP